MSADVPDERQEHWMAFFGRKARLGQHRKSGFHPRKLIRAHDAKTPRRGLKKPWVVPIDEETTACQFPQTSRNGKNHYGVVGPGFDALLLVWL